MFSIQTILLLFEIFMQCSGRETFFPTLPIAVLNTKNQVCKLQSELYLKSLENGTLWAHEMWDSTAKSSTGVLRGNTFQMGHFDQCISTKAPFLTQYCLARVEAKIPPDSQSSIKDPLSLYHNPFESVLIRFISTKDVSQQRRNVVQMGWCIPASCSIKDMENYLKEHFNSTRNETVFNGNNVTYEVNLNELLCNKMGENRIKNADIGVLCTILIILIIAATICDLMNNKNRIYTELSFPRKLLLNFSVRLNYMDLIKNDQNESALRVLHGTKTLCIFMIIIDHRFGTYISSALLNFDYVETQYRTLFACFLFRGDLFVDSFFLLGGLLVTYGLLNQFDKKIINPVFIVLLRYIRLTPVYAFVIFYYATLFSYTGSGPLWKLIAGQDSQDCKDNWWLNLLYLNNYINPEHMCMTHAWYLPCDFHYFIIGLVVCLVIKSRRNLGLGLLFALFIASLVVPFVIVMVNQRPPMLRFYPEFLTGPKTHPDFLMTYTKSHTRATPYFVGMFAGYLYYKIGKIRHSDTYRLLTPLKTNLIIIVSVLLIVSAFVGGMVFYDVYHKYNALEAGTYASLHRVGFALGSVGLLYVASYGQAKFIYDILAWRPWILLSKLIYCAYLIHMQFQLRSAARFHNPEQISYFDVLSLAVADITLSFLAAFILYLMIEAPFRRVFRDIFTPPSFNQTKISTETKSKEMDVIGERELLQLKKQEELINLQT